MTPEQRTHWREVCQQEHSEIDPHNLIIVQLIDDVEALLRVGDELAGVVEDLDLIDSQVKQANMAIAAWDKVRNGVCG